MNRDPIQQGWGCAIMLMGAGLAVLCVAIAWRLIAG